MAGKPGHGGKKGRSGRKPSPTLNIKRALETLSNRLPVLIERLTTLAIGEKFVCPHCKRESSITKPNSDDLKYLIDRVLGRAPQAIDHRIRAQISVTADDLELATRVAQAYEIAILDDSKLLEAAPHDGRELSAPS